MNCDRIAGAYRWLEVFTFGPFLWRSRTHFLPMAEGRQRALLLGDGDGRFTAAVMRRFPGMCVHSIELSRRMLQQAARRLWKIPTAATVYLEQANALTCPLPESIDVVYTHFFFDVLTQPETESLAHRVALAALPECLWIVSDFHIPGTGSRRWIAQRIVALLYYAFRLMTGLTVSHLPDHASALSAVGFQLRHRHLSLGGLLFSELWIYEPNETLANASRI